MPQGYDAEIKAKLYKKQKKNKMKDIKNEIWRDVVNYEGLYQVSNFGNIKSIKKNKNLKLLPNKRNGYYEVSLSKMGIVKRTKVHQLVAIAFLNHTPSGMKLVVNHKDFDINNNSLDNLEIITQRENCNFKHIKSISKYVGVTWSKQSKKWTSRICVNKERIYLGLFDKELDAHNAYQNKLSEILKKI